MRRSTILNYLENILKYLRMKLLFCTVLLIGLFGLIKGKPLDEEILDEEDSDSSEHGMVTTRVHNNCTCGTANKTVTKIVNGKATERNEFPLIAGLVHLKKDLAQCGGFIITSRHIVTAAHCTYSFNITEYGVFIGHNSYVHAKNEIQLLRPEKFYIHEKFDRFTLQYDISIILMKDKIQFSDTVRPACLPTAKLDLIGEKVTLLGWGRVASRSKTSEVLLKVKVFVVDASNCSFHDDFEKVDIHQFCTFRKGKDSCKGDSGGPVLWVDPDTNRYTAVGIISYGISCGKYVAINSDVVYFLPWIQRIVSESDPSMKTCAKV